MKKFLIFIVMLFSLCACTNIKHANIDTIIADATQSELNLVNEYRTGYKYYLPTNINVNKSVPLNEILFDGKNYYYLFVDLVSYHDKVKLDYKEKSNIYYSKAISFNEKTGYLEISVNNDKYLIEIMYNYAKIEVMVDKDSINEAVANSMTILSSIMYNDEIIDNMMGDDILNYSEEKFSIFDDNTVKDSNFLEYVQEYDNYDSKNNVPDYDLRN